MNSISPRSSSPTSGAASASGHDQTHATGGQAPRRQRARDTLESTRAPALPIAPVATHSRPAAPSPVVASDGTRRSRDPVRILMDLERTYTCPVDLELLQDAVALPCGHLFNEDGVIPAIIAAQERCPTCRSDVDDLGTGFPAAMAVRQFCHTFARAFPHGAAAAHPAPAARFLRTIERGEVVLPPEREPATVRPRPVAQQPRHAAQPTVAPPAPATTPSFVQPFSAQGVLDLALAQSDATLLLEILLQLRGNGAPIRAVAMAMWLQRLIPALREEGLLLLADNPGTTSSEQNETRQIINNQRTHPRASRRRLAVEALGQLDGANAATALLEQARTETHPTVVLEIVRQLSRAGIPRRTRAMALWLQTAVPAVREDGLTLLCANPGSTTSERDEVRQIINTQRSHRSAARRLGAVQALIQLDGAAANPALLEQLSHETDPVVIVAIFTHLGARALMRAIRDGLPMSAATRSLVTDIIT